MANPPSPFGSIGSRARRASLADLDGDLFAGLGARELARAREIAAPVVQLEPGRWRPELGGAREALGLLVLDGLLMQTVSLGDEAATQVVGAGDLIRPWDAPGPDVESVVPCDTGWTVLAPARLAVLGRQVAFAAADCPGLVVALMERAVRPARSQRILTAIAHMKRIDVRVLVLLWHLAERSGRVTPEGVAVPLRLTHREIATLVGAQRPSVTAALTRMTERGLVARPEGRGFLLTSAARDELRALCASGERAVSPLMVTCA